MEFNKEDKTIKINRGSIGTIKITNKNGNFAIGDKLKLSIVEKGNYNNVLFQKEYEITEESNVAYIILTSEDTRFCDVISKEEVFWYEIEYNGEQTLIGYDDNKAKKFIIYPEAPNKGVNTNE